MATSPDDVRLQGKTGSSWPTTKMTRLTRIGHPAGFAFYELLLARSMIDQLGSPRTAGYILGEMTMMRILVHLVPLTIVAATIVPSAAHAQNPLACKSLAGLKIDNVNLLSATTVGSTTDLPSHCRVLGFVRPAINFEFAARPELERQVLHGRLRRFLRHSRQRPHGFTNAMNYGLRRNYAVSTMDAGHWGLRSRTGAGLQQSPCRDRWGSRAVTETAKVQRRLSAPTMTNRKRNPTSPAAQPAVEWLRWKPNAS